MTQQWSNLDILHAARCIADNVVRTGLFSSHISCRPICHHMGAVLADSVLQAGLNYTNIVKPRIANIIKTFPHATTVKALIKIIEIEGSSKFLQWEHYEKVSRFNNLIDFLTKANIESTFELRKAFQDKSFHSNIQQVRGIGPKTADYMACLVGVDCIAVDRHIRSFAEFAGLEIKSYDYLRDVFNFAADLLSISRREFDASIWQYQSEKNYRQLSLEFMH